ncbi:hypothetical protein ACFOTA_00945 [Chitinophaga sp. GCM10012297]|uniref:Restriction endonuclease n=1 Tax=Chitinophaga chungangae TaxID=2821488 RepID=A0ABS3Y8V7_9BACT|nr:hypothetical protein [Chitinophaga chungangae]MBO9150758.1 hypothetical protein [Chitinophaga chungangae]
MPTKKATDNKIVPEKKSAKSPFKDQTELEDDIKSFINKYKSTVINHATRISDFFEMSCYNLIVQYYEHLGYEVTIQNLKDGKYRYKCSPSGIQSNFSYFEISKKVGRKKFSFEIQHNLAVQSSFDDEIFVTPDISIIRKNSAKETIEYYDTRRKFSYVLNKDLLTFFEVKQFNPFPELIFNFIGIVNELKKSILKNKLSTTIPAHLAPSLMISGKPNKPTKKIKKSLEKRYCINIIYDIFDSGHHTFSKDGHIDLRQFGENSSSSKDESENDPFDLPF